MKNSKFLLIIVILILLSAGFLGLTGWGKIPVPKNILVTPPLVNQISNNQVASNQIADNQVADNYVADNQVISNSAVIITEPLAGAVVESPLAVTGQAPGNWFFEATLPIKLIDANNNLLVATAARATADWATTSLVSFTASLDFATTSVATGYLVISKDNPSGLPQNDASITIPIKFK